ncbi:substrate-binding periplasmic protein [Nocardioides sp.]|uniref:substrate-binding periplasmic protein n=1 Tax=Nocardioides sp. TaxID=35761 RepID=UPI0035AD9F86
MMIRKAAAIAACAIVGLGVLTACSPDSQADSAAGGDCEPAHEFKTVSDGVLTVSAYELPPFGTFSGNEFGGIDGAILDEIAAMECLTVKASPGAAAAVIPTVQGGRADLAATGWYRTAARAEVVDLTDPIYLDQMALVSKSGISSIPELKEQGLSVGSVDGYLWVEDLKKYLGSSFKTYASGLNCNQDLEVGRVDVCVDSIGSGSYAAKDMDGIKVELVEPFDEVAASIEPAQTTFPIQKGHEDLLTALNEDIATLRENGRLAEILEENGLDPSGAEPGEARLIG